MVMVDPDDAVEPDRPAAAEEESGVVELDRSSLDDAALDNLASDRADDPTRRRRLIRRTRNVMLIVLAVVLVIAGVTVGPSGWQVFQQRNTKVAAPNQAAGLQRNDNDGATTTADYIRDAIDTEVNLDTSIGAVYWDGTNQDRSVLFAGGDARLWSPADRLTDAFKVITDDTGGVRDIRTVPAGPLGGVMRCGTTKTDLGDIAVCGWADHGSLAVALFPNRSVDEAAKLMLELRTATEHR
jgi:hypothetical protein